MQYAEVAPNAKTQGLFETFTYAVPDDFWGDIAVGQLVQIPLGPRTINGIVIELHDRRPKFATKDIKKIIDLEPAVDDIRLQLARQIAEHYFTPLSQVLFHMLPPNIRRRRRILKGKVVESAEGGHPSESQANNQQLTTNNPVLTSYQEDAVDKIYSAISQGDFTPFLLHGVTGSGKTEVYLRAFAEVLGRGKSGIFIVPEISLTPQSIQRFTDVFGPARIAVVHSHQTLGERSSTWQAIRDGEKDIVIGSRSAIFAPLKNLSLIIVDEEHDLISFKSDQTPRYELHMAAESLAQLTDSILVLGSATPLVTTYDRVLEREYTYLSLPERVDGKSLPPVEIIDMNLEKQSGNYSFLSEQAQLALQEVLNQKKQAILFLNRRGMATLSRCQECGQIAHCEDCDSALVYHLSNHRLWCHHCGRQYEPKVTCTQCGGVDIRLLGQGTEKVEFELKKLFPQAIIARMDRDTMEKGGDYETIFRSFQEGHIDILIGTQMVVHGWDIPNVDLAVVVSLDGPLMLPDHRAEEGVFQILEQLAGRTGRGERQGKMLIQTLYPEHPAFDFVKNHDYTGFVQGQLAHREEYAYPPFVRLVALSYGAKTASLAQEKADALVDVLRFELSHLPSEQQEHVELIGPLEPLMARRYGKYFMTIVIKIQNPKSKIQDTGVALRRVLEKVPKDWTIDIDPVSLL